MQKDDRNLLEVLKFELQFLEKGGYGRSPREPWKATLPLEDSPTCMNYDTKASPTPCKECILMALVPPDHRGEKVPCRHIPLTKEGETLDYFYRWGTQDELEGALKSWLRAMIVQLEPSPGPPAAGKKPS